MTFRTLLRPVALAALGLAGAGALAQTTSPYTLTASETLTGNWNVYNATNGAQRDIISDTGLGFNLDQLLGRQRLLVDLGVDRNAYRNHTDLNSTTYNTSAALEMESIGNFSGEAKLSATRGASINANLPDLTTTDLASLRGQLGVNSMFGLEGALAHRKVKYSQNHLATPVANHADDFSETITGLGVYARPSDVWTFGAGVRKTSTDYTGLHLAWNGNDPILDANGNQEQTVQSYTGDRRDIDLTAQWKPTELTTARARLSRTKYDETPYSAENNQTTGAIGLSLRPSSVVELTAEFRRDTEDGYSSFDLNQGQTSSLNAEMANSLLLGARWEATAMVIGNAEVGVVQHKYANSTGLAGTVSDNVRHLTLGATYTPRRWIAVTGGVRFESQSGAAGWSNDYSTRAANLGVKLTLN